MSGNDKIGDRVRITGAADFYQGEPELQVSKDGSGKDLVMLLGEGDPVEPAEGNAGGILNRSAEGKLVTRKGVVTGCEIVNDRVRTILVRGADGKTARVFIDGCITAEQEQEAKNLALGAESTVTGLASYDDTFNAPKGPFERIRSRADAVCGEVVEHVHDYVWTTTKAPTCTEPGHEAPDLLRLRREGNGQDPRAEAPGRRRPRHALPLGGAAGARRRCRRLPARQKEARQVSSTP